MDLIDLHVHSLFSDGTLSPAELVDLALSKELKAIAITDHDTMDGVKEAVAAAEGSGLEIIPGTELSCLYHDREIHMLGYYTDYNSQSFKDALQRQRELRNRRNEEMIRRFAEDGMYFTLEELQDGNPGTVITRAHFARVLIQKGYVSTVDQAFKRYLEHGKKYCPPKQAFSPEEAIRLITDAGGFPSLAHPMAYKMSWKEIEAMIAEFRDFGLKGVEVCYSSHRQYESSRLRGICNASGLLPTGGSDFHGRNKPDIELGTGRGGLRVPAVLLKDIKKALAFPAAKLL